MCVKSHLELSNSASIYIVIEEANQIVGVVLGWQARRSKEYTGARVYDISAVFSHARPSKNACLCQTLQYMTQYTLCFSRRFFWSVKCTKYHCLIHEITVTENIYYTVHNGSSFLQVLDRHEEAFKKILDFLRYNSHPSIAPLLSHLDCARGSLYLYGKHSANRSST